MFQSFLTILIVGFASISTVAKAQAQVSVGIDHATQNVINQLAPNARDALVKSLAEALPTIDKSITTYLQQIEKLIDTDLSQPETSVKCGDAGTATIASNEARSSISNFVYAGPTTISIGDYNRHISDVISEKRAELNIGSKAADLAQTYSGLLIRAAIIKCAANIKPEFSQPEVDAQIARLKAPAFEWRLVVNDDRLRCVTIHDCVVARRKEVEALIATADERDLEIGKVKKLWGAVPGVPTRPSSAFPLYRASIQVLDYELVLYGLRTVERAVLAPRARRLSKASEAMSTAQSELAALVSFVSTPKSADAIVAQHKAAVDKGKSAITRSNEAVVLNSEQKSEAKKLQDSVKVHTEAANKQLSDAQVQLKKIEDERIEQFKERMRALREMRNSRISR